MSTRLLSASFPLLSGCVAVRWLLATGAVLWTAPATAQTLDYGALEELFGEPVTTSVTGSPQVASDVPATMAIITAEDIRRSGAFDIPGILRYVTGVDVLRWTNSGADVGIRGYNKAFSARLLVLVNGRQVYADHYGYTPWSSLPVEFGEIRQIEVIKGPNSALFGFNAVGGVINIITFNPALDAVNYATVRGGTQNLVSASAATTFDVTSDWHVRISGGARQNDDFNTPQRMVNIGSRRGDERTSVRLDSHHAWSPAVEFEVEASWTETKQTNMVPIYLTAFEEMQVGSLKAGLNADTRYGLVQASVYRNWLDNRAFNGFFDGQQMVESNVPLVDFSNELTVARLQDIFKLGTAHTLRLSLEYRESEMNTSPTPGGEIHYDVASGGVMWQWQLLETLTLTSAARRDHLQLGREGVIPEWYGLANSAWDRSLAQTSFNIGLVWKVGARDTLRLSTARGAQLPSLFDLGGNLLTLPIPPEFGPPNAVFLSGMPDLQPTLVTNQELAWDHQLPGLNAALKVAVFRGRSTALIANYGNFLPQLNVVSAPANIGDSQSEGVELAIEGRLGDAWQWSVGYLQLDVDDDFAPQFPAGWTYVNFEETAPRHNVNASLAWTGGPWDVDLRLQYLSDFMSVRYDDEYIFNFFVPTAPTVLYPVSGYVTVGGRIGYRVNDKVTAALSVQNLFNDEQRQTAGPDVERRVMASLTYSF